MKELTPEEAARKLGLTKKDPDAKPIAAIPGPKPGTGLKRAVAHARVGGTPPPPDPPAMGAIMEAASRPEVYGEPPADGFGSVMEQARRSIVVVGRAPAIEQEGAGGAEGAKMVAGLYPWGDVIPRADNPRMINEKSPKFLSLVESVGGPLGVVTPGIARPHPTLPGKYELLAGHRRHRAAGVCGHAVFPLIVRELDDHEALLLLVFENLDREDLTPLEEARGVKLLLEQGFEAEEISARVKKPVAWVARRVKLLQLTVQWRTWAEEWQVSAAHLELIARLSREMQEELFDQLTEDEYVTQECFFQPGSLANLRKRLQEEMRELKQAPWELDNAVLHPKAGACSVCPKRSGCQPDLFSDPEDAGDRCLDTDCWKEKMATYKKQREAELRKVHPDLVLIAGKHADYREEEAWRKRTLNSWDFTECNKSAAGAVPALIVCGKGDGSLTWVKLKEGRGQGTRESAAKPAKVNAATKQAEASLDPAESARLLAEKQAAHEQRRWAEVAKRLLLALNESSLPLAEEFRSAEGLLRLVRVFGTEALDSRALWMSERERTWRKVQMAYGMETLEEVWQMLKPQIRKTLEIYKVSDIGAETHAAIAGVAGLLCRDLAVLKAEVDAEIPEPKSWEQLRRLAEAPAKEKEHKGTKKTKADKKPAAEKKGPKA